MSVKRQRLPLGLADWFVGLKRYSKFAPNCFKINCPSKHRDPTTYILRAMSLRLFRKKGVLKTIELQHMFNICHFRVSKTLTFKARLGAKPSFISMKMKKS